VSILLILPVERAGAAPPPSPPVLVTTDISPDTPYATHVPSVFQGTTSGRVNGIAVDPSNPLVVYAASEWSGVWKSIDGAKTWTQSANGLRSGLTQGGNGTVIAADADSKRVLYVTQAKDGRGAGACTNLRFQCGHFGGLWVSVDAAATWKHVDPPGCPDPATYNVLSAGFSDTVAFVATDSPNCLLVASGDSNLATWLSLPDPPVVTGPNHHYFDIVAAPGATPTLFACQDGLVWRTVAPSSPNSWTALILPASSPFVPSCDGLAPVSPTDTAPGPIGTPPTASTVVVSASGSPAPNKIQREAYAVDFTASMVTDLGTYSTDSGSGTQNVFVGPHAVPGPILGPGRSYDVFAADSLRFWKYRPGDSWDAFDDVHADTWSMAFPSSYDPPNGHCTAYASNDGGVYVNRATGSNCGRDWVLASTGLRLLMSITVNGFSRPVDSDCLAAHAPSQSPCPVLYLPSADDDQWVSDIGGTPGSWKYLDDNLGDAGQTFLDPTSPSTALAIRNGNYHFKSSGGSNPPDDFGGYHDVTPKDAFIGLQSQASEGGVTQVLTLPKLAYDHDDFFALVSLKSLLNLSGKTGGGNDEIYRNETIGSSGDGQWVPVTTAGARFGPGNISALAASGGHDSPTLYVLTTDGNYFDSADDTAHLSSHIYKGHFTLGNPTHTPSWQSASGFGFSPNLLKAAFGLYVNPYDPDELYTTDLGDGSIRVSRDGGQTWLRDQTLRDVATNYGEFDFDCGNQPWWDRYYHDKEMFGGECPLDQMVFVRDNPGVRVAVLYPGGVAFSRDGGHHWIPLHVTKELASEQPIELPKSAFYDPTPDPDSGGKNTVLYIGLEGRGMKRVEGPFATLESARVTFCAICIAPGYTPSSVSAVVDDPIDQTVPLHPIGNGFFQGDFPFDSATTSSVSYHFVADTTSYPTVSQPLSPDEQATGVMALTNSSAPAVGVSVAGTGTNANGVRYVDLQFRNVGLVPVSGVTIDRIRRRGGARLVPELSPPLPLPIGSLDPAASATVRFFVQGTTGAAGGRIVGNLSIEDVAGRFSKRSFTAN
jgi:hypothetical protein